MARDILVGSHTFFSASDGTTPNTLMTVDLVSDWIDIGKCDGGVDIFVSHTVGTAPVGSMILQATNDTATVKARGVNVASPAAVAVPFLVPTVGSAGAGLTLLSATFNIPGNSRPGRYVRVVYDFTSGTANVSADYRGVMLGT